ncbi:MAG: NnrU family protein [Rhodospirillales bacterium]
MNLYLLGLALFFLPHLVPLIRPLRAAVVGGMGENPWKMTMTALNFAGIALIFFAFRDVPYEELWAPQPVGRMLLFVLMPVVFILLAAANMQGRIRRAVRHPMSIAIAIWSGAHLLANGDLASTLLFGAFFVYTIVGVIAAEMQGRVKVPQEIKGRQDVIAIVAGLVLFAVVMHFHGWLFGVPVVG